MSSAAEQHSGLAFPFAEPPEPGGMREIAPGIIWLRFALPFLLDHVNIYLIEDDGGWAVLDTGLGDQRTRSAWEHLLAGPLAGRRLTRLIVTHFHPDHVGAAGWLADRHELPLWMSRTEYLLAIAMRHRSHGGWESVYREFYRQRGLAPELIEQVVGPGHRYLDATTPLPGAFHRLVAGETLVLGGRRFEVLTGGGHAPEQAMLFCRDEALFFAADQVIAKISPNVSVWPMEPQSDPLADYVQSLNRLRAALPADALVLPAHNLPFFGLHERVAELLAHHDERCAIIAAACADAPRSVPEFLPLLFRRALDAHQLGFAIGEAMAHVNYMLRRGELAAVTGDDDVSRFVTL